MSFISVAKNYIAEKADKLKKAVLSEESTDAKKTSQKNNTAEPVKLVSDEALNQDADMGLSVQKTSKPTTLVSAKEQTPKTLSTAESKTSGSVNKTDNSEKVRINDPKTNKSFNKPIKCGQPGQKLDVDFLMKNKYVKSKEQWDNMSQQEQEAVKARFIENAINDHNKAHPDKPISVEHQFRLYMRRCSTPEEAEELARVCARLDKNNQLRGMIESCNFENEEMKAAALRGIASRAGDFDQSVQKDVHGFIQASGNEDAQAIAAVEAQKIKDIKVQKEVVQDYQAIGSKKVDMAVSSHIGEYFRDENGEIKPGSEAEKYQMELWQNGLQNASSEEARANYARNTYQLTRDNQTPASDMVMQTNNEAYINAMAENAYKFDESIRDSVITKLENSGYDSVKNTLKEAKAQYEAEQKAKAENSETKADNESKTSKEAASNVSASSLKEAEQRIMNIIHNKSLNTTQKAKQLKTLVGKEQTVALSQVIKTSTGPELKSLALSGLKTEVIKYLFDNYSPENASALDSLSELMNSAEKHQYEEIKSKYLGETKTTNFFIH